MKSATLTALDTLFFRKQSGGTAQFTELFNKHQGLVRSVIYQIVGESALNDLSQEAFIRIWKGYSKFRSESEVTSWIYRISVNVALDYLRQKKRKAEDLVYDFSFLIDENNPIDENLAKRQLVQLSLKTLTEEQRTVVVLALIHELAISEIADILEISEGTVKSRLHYAKEHLRNFLEKENV